MTDNKATNETAAVRLERELARLERQWAKERLSYLHIRYGRDQSGPLRFMGWLAVLAGSVSIGLGLWIEEHGMVFVGTVSLGLGAWILVTLAAKAKAYNAARRRYLHRRQELVQRFEASAERAGKEGDDHSLD